MVDDEDLIPLRGSIRSYDEADSDRYSELFPPKTIWAVFVFAAAHMPTTSLSTSSPQPHHNINYYDESVDLRHPCVNGYSQDMPRILRSRSPSLRICPRRGCSNEGEFTDFNSYTGETFG